VEGAITIKPIGKYNVDLSPADKYIAEPYGANLTVDDTGLHAEGNGVLKLDSGTVGSYDVCTQSEYSHYKTDIDIDWSELTAGMQICLKTTYSGLHVSLLTVLANRPGPEADLKIDTWDCPAAAGKSTC
jgi:hypothetical protein